MNTLTALAVLLALVVGYVATASATPRSRRREAERRARRVARHPSLANLGDVRVRLDAELSAPHAAFVLERVARHGIDAATLWTWLDRFGADALVLALAAGHGYAGVLRILRDETSYDEGEARVLAELGRPDLFVLAAA